MKTALFLGCTIPARSRNYELSARAVARKAGIELVDVEGFACCGFPLKSADLGAAEVMGAYNLALAEQQGLDLCVLCSSCASALTEIAHHLSTDAAHRDEVNQVLARAGLRYEGNVRVRHFARILVEDIGPKGLKAHIERPLNGLKIAVHYGCHYLKPSEIYEGFDAVESPETLDRLLAVTGVELLSYADRLRCCGGPLLPVDEEVALSIAKAKLDDVQQAGAHAIALVCPFCSVMYDGNQKGIESAFGASYDLPVLYLTQILGLAMGFDRKELGLNMNVVKTKKLLAGLEEKE